ncbi:retrotransposon protein, putative, ty1-copia subclass [Tanacetum coccineum]
MGASLPKNNPLLLFLLFEQVKSEKANKHNILTPSKGCQGHKSREWENKHPYASKSQDSPSPKREDSAKDSLCSRVCRVAIEEKDRKPLELVVVQGLRASRKLKHFKLVRGQWSTSIYTVSNKRAKLDLDSALLWNCRLGHISKKPIEKLQHDGLLNSTDLKALEKYIPCMSGKMALKNLHTSSGKGQRLTWTNTHDDGGPFKITYRQGATTSSLA